MYDLVNWEHTGKKGLTLRGWRTTPRGLPVIFFLHGNGLCGMSYWPMLRRLQERFDVVVLDTPGHGLSDSPGTFQGWEDDAACCYEAWASLAGEYKGVSHHSVGHSYGGVISTIFMAENPESFDSAVLLDPVYFPSSMLIVGRTMDSLGLLRFSKLSRITRKRRDQWPSRDAMCEYFLSKRVYAKWDRECLDAYVYYGSKPDDDGGVRLSCARELEAKIYCSLPYGLPRMIRRLTTPTVIYSGDRSYDFVIKGLPKYCSGHPNVEHREIPGSHNFMLEQPEKVASWVSECLVTG